MYSESEKGNEKHKKMSYISLFSAIVDGRKNSTPGIDTTNILNELLADDVWLEQVSGEMIY